MKISTIATDMGALKMRQTQLLNLLDQPTHKQTRPCVGCRKLCSCAKRSSHCCCGCSPQCPDASAMLSSQPDRYPIEPLVLPVVFALAELRLVSPCWSCQGHLREDQSWLRLPQIWFYAQWTIYPELIAKHLANLKHKAKTSHTWIVQTCSFSQDPLVSMYMICPSEPALSTENTATLKELQEDLAKIASSLVADVHSQARNKLKRLESMATV